MKPPDHDADRREHRQQQVDRPTTMVSTMNGTDRGEWFARTEHQLQGKAEDQEECRVGQCPAPEFGADARPENSPTGQVVDGHESLDWQTLGRSPGPRARQAIRRPPPGAPWTRRYWIQSSLESGEIEGIPAGSRTVVGLSQRVQRRATVDQPWIRPRSPANRDLAGPEPVLSPGGVHGEAFSKACDARRIPSNPARAFGRVVVPRCRDRLPPDENMIREGKQDPNGPYCHAPASSTMPARGASCTSLRRRHRPRRTAVSSPAGGTVITDSASSL